MKNARTWLPSFFRHQSKRRKKLFLRAFGALFLLFVVWGIVYDRVNTAGDMLIVSVDNSWKNEGPISLVDLTTGMVSPISFIADGCDGIAGSINEQRVYTSCRIGKEPYVAVDVHEHKVSDQVVPFSHQSSPRTPLVCAKDGTCYYGFGKPDRRGYSDARIMQVKDGELRSIITHPYQDKNEMIVGLQLENDSLWILSSGPGDSDSHVLRYDLAKKRFEQTGVEIPGSVWNFSVGNGKVAVSVNREKVGADVIVYDALNKTELKRLVLPGMLQTFNAIGIVIDGSSLYVAGTTGVHVFSLQSFEEIGFAPTEAQAAEIAVGGGHLYVGVPETERVYEFDTASLRSTREFNIPLGYGEIRYISW